MNRRFSHLLILTALAVSTCFVTSSCGSSRRVVAHHQTGVRHHRGSEKPEPSIKHIPIDRGQMHASTVKLLREADSWLGVPYKFGGEDRNGVDCSAMVMNVFGNSLNIKVPRNSRKQYAFCQHIDRKNLIPGDLIFFSTPSSSEIGHVGIYIGDDRMIHASSSRGVVVSDVNSDYFQSHYKGSGRIQSYYAMLVPQREMKPVEPTMLPEPLIADNGTPKSVKIEKNTKVVKEIPLSVLVASNNAGGATEKPLVAVSPNIVNAAQNSAVTVVNPTKMTDSSASDEEDARRRVLSSYAEQPADSVLTPFFD